MNINKTFTIYKYTSPSGKVYIGKTYVKERRRKEHVWVANGGCLFPFHKAIRK